MRGFLSSVISEKRTPRTYLSRELKTSSNEVSVFNRQAIIPGFNQEKLSSATVVLVGAGGLGGEIAEGLVKKGVGEIKIFDPDVVEPSNLNRQFFFKKDLYKNKAICLSRNLSKMGFGKTTLIGHPYSFEDAISQDDDLICSLAIIGVDNNLCRVIAGRYYLNIKISIPVIFTAVSEDGNAGYVFIQESKPDKPCFGCLQPQAVKEVKSGNLRFPCPSAPAIKDILKVMGGLVIFAVDTLLMDRNRNWNYRVVYLDESIPSGTNNLRRKKHCPLCG